MSCEVTLERESLRAIGRDRRGARGQQVKLRAVRQHGHLGWAGISLVFGKRSGNVHRRTRRWVRRLLAHFGGHRLHKQMLRGAVVLVAVHPVAVPVLNAVLR